MSRRATLPGFGPALGVTVTYLSLVVLIPLATLFGHAAAFSVARWLALLGDHRVLAALRLSFGAAAMATVVAGLGGLLVAWVLVRVPFPGRKLANALVDLPFALPTAVAGIALASLYAPQGWLGQWLQPFGLRLAFAPAGVVVAMIFIAVPFVVRAVEPVLADLPRETEEAAASLGASPARVVWRVLLPPVLPALTTGMSLAFARAVGEYGSIIFIAGNLPHVSEIAPLLIVTKLEQYDYAGATALAVVMLLLSFVVLLAVNAGQAWARRRRGGL